MHLTTILIFLYLAFHIGFAHSTYRHRRTQEGHKVNLYWMTIRGPWISIKGPGAWKMGH